MIVKCSEISSERPEIITCIYLGQAASSAGVSPPSRFMISSSSTLRAARKLITEPLVCVERYRTFATSRGHQPRSHNTERPASEKPHRNPQPAPATTQLKTRINRLPQNSQSKANPSNGDPEREKRLLEPYVLSQRLVKLATQGQLDEAVHMLQNSPLDASNVATWNTILLHCMMEERFKLGYKLFVDVRALVAPNEPQRT